MAVFLVILLTKKQKHIDIRSHICLLTQYIDYLHREYRNRQLQAVDDFSHAEARPSVHVLILSRSKLICTEYSVLLPARIDAHSAAAFFDDTIVVRSDSWHKLPKAV